MQSRAKRILIKILKITGWVIFSIFLLLVSAALLIQVPALQLKLTQKAVSFLEKKIGTRVALKNIHIAFPKDIVLEGIYLEDQKGDTLLYAGKFSIDTDLWALTQKEIQLNRISLENAAAFMDRPEKDSAFNFTYILNAFAGDSTAVPDTLEQKHWNFILRTISLHHIRLQFHDLLTGNHAGLALGNFELTMDNFDLYHNVFGVNAISLADTRIQLEQTKLPIVEDRAGKTSSDMSSLNLSLKSIALRNVDVNYEQSALGQMVRMNLQEAEVDARKIDLVNQQIFLDEVVLKGSSLAYQQHESSARPASSQDNPVSGQPASVGKPWEVSLNTLDLSNNSFQYYDLRKPMQKGAVDFNHLWVTNFALNARNILYNQSNIEASLRNLSFHERSGFSIQSFKTEVRVTETSANIRDFLLLTGNSRLQLQAEARFNSLEHIAGNYPQATVSTNINESFVNVRDILYFNPSFLDSLPVHLPSDARLRIDAALNGKVNNLHIQHLIFSALEKTYLDASGDIAGLPDVRKMRVDVALNKLYTTRGDIQKILPDTLLPDSLKLPEWINLRGGFKGSIVKAAFNSTVSSNVGTVEAKGEMNLDSTSALRGFDASLALNELDIGKILMKPDTVMGKLTMAAHVHAVGLTPEEMNGTLTGSVDHFDYLGYSYRDLKLKGEVRNDALTATVTLTDKNLDFTLAGDYNYQDKVPTYNVTLDLKNADFKALHFSQRPLKARGTLLANIATSDFKVMNGKIGLRKVAVFNGDDLYAVDSLLFASIDQEGRSEINIDSDLLTARFEGSFNIFSMPGALRAYFSDYYSLHDSLVVKDTERQHFRFDIKLKNTDLITGILVPDLTSFVPGKITGEFDSQSEKLDLRMEINEIQYTNIGVRSFVFTAKSDPSALRYNFTADWIMVDSMRVDGLEFNGRVANDSIRTELIILDSLDAQKYVLAATFLSRNNLFELHLSPDRTKLNYVNWKVPADNFIRFGGPKVVAQNVQLVNGREKIIIESKDRPGSPILIGFRELNLEYLSSMVAQQKPVSGLLQGDINLYPDSTGMNFTSDLHVANFMISNIPWGDLSLAVEQKVRNRFDINFGMSGKENQVTVKGFYSAGSNPSVDLTTTIEKFSLGSLQPLLAAQLKNLAGNLNGTMTIRGTPAKPDIAGAIQVADTHFLSTYLNSSYSILNETILFNDRGISFNNFQIADNSKNEARINGMILTKTYRDFQFDLNIISDHFRVINTTEKDNKLFYGKVDIQANARLRGNITTPVIDMEIGLSDGSDLTYVVPQTEASVMETDGIVKFIDRTFEGDPFMKKIHKEAADTVKSVFTGIDLTAKIELTDRESFTIIIDPVTKDQLTVKGNTTLTLKVDPTGDIQLSGRYEISEGTYNLSFYKFVKREFTMDKGGTITWSGDPLNAEVDISAIYKVETSPIELFANAPGTTDMNQYKQTLPFLVYLSISGDLLQPDIAFKLEMPMTQRNAFGGSIYARLQDINTRESELNKQVFALLILKRFIADNPFENQAGGGLESTARNSVSKILSEQLNRLSDKVKGVELSFDIKSYEDYSSGQAQGQTELQLGFSKTLLHDRLVVKLSGNIDVEGQNANRNATDYIGDLALEYKLTPDGRFRITGFRNSNYDMIDGELTETGAGLIYVKDYNTLSELFKANAKTKN